MRLIAGIAFAFVLSTAAVAQQSTYVPITINETDYQQLRTYLEQQPWMFANPLIRKFDDLERQAIDAKKKAEQSAPPPKEESK